MAVVVVGAGNFGTVLANIVASNDTRAYLWLRDRVQYDDIRSSNENRRYLPGHSLHPNVVPTMDLPKAVKSSKLILMTLPSSSFRSVARDVGRSMSQDSYVVSGTKGVETESFKLMSEVLQEELPPCSVGVLSGPNLAEEIAEHKFAGTVIASSDADLVKHVQDKLSSPTFRVYSSEDVFGVELGGALKNIYAIICGIAAGLDVGQNAVSMVITRSLVEMSRFAQAIGANPYTFLGLAGVGDLVATCTSPHSRNFQLGNRIASGMTLEEAMEQLGKLAEGVNTLKAVYQRKEKMDLYMPLVDALYRVIFKGEGMQEAIHSLMVSEQKIDVGFAMQCGTPGTE